MGGHNFRFVTALELERDATGGIRELSPQGRYEKSGTASLNQHGAGNFCKFRIPVPKYQVGVYALVEDGAVRYIGECEDLGKRFNAGYGNISPKNCYVGGQPTNCKINHHVLDIAKAGRRVLLYFYPTTDRYAVEKHLIGMYIPPWNSRDRV
jgi:hypothetical protein